MDGLVEGYFRLLKALIALTVAGQVKGGLGYVANMAACMLSALSGPAVANAAALASLLVPMMVAAGHSRKHSAGLTDTLATIRKQSTSEILDPAALSLPGPSWPSAVRFTGHKCLWQRSPIGRYHPPASPVPLSSTEQART